MKREEFREWLIDCGYRPNVVNSRVTNCETVCTYEGDLDDFFDIDRCESLIQRLNYTTDDERNNRPAKHKIPINGNQRTGSATLKQAVNLYVKFRMNETVSVKPVTVRTSSINFSSSSSKGSWPVWPLPDEDECYQLAQISTKYIRFLSPEIIKSIVDFNEEIRKNIEQRLEENGINPQLYIWERSSCCFPGVRRYAGSSEIAAYRKRTEIAKIEDALSLDDNDYPKQVWSFIFRGCQFNKFGPDGYSLAHLIDHKKDKNRMPNEFIFPENNKFKPLYGLYTCASNSVYIPNNLMKPTDFNGQIRNLLVRKAYSLYHDVCNIIPSNISIPEPSDEKWNLDQFEWADPVGSIENVKDFNLFRIRKFVNLLGIKI